MQKSVLVFTVAALALSTSQPLAAQDDVDQQLGNVHFNTSCNEVAQRRFDRAMRYQHSYWYINAREIFEEVIKADPTCAMAYWGIALTLMDNPHVAIPRPNLAPGLAAITKAREIGAKTERERDYIDALTPSACARCATSRRRSQRNIRTTTRPRLPTQSRSIHQQT